MDNRSPIFDKVYRHDSRQQHETSERTAALRYINIVHPPPCRRGHVGICREYVTCTDKNFAKLISRDIMHKCLHAVRKNRKIRLTTSVTPQFPIRSRIIQKKAKQLNKGDLVYINNEHQEEVIRHAVYINTRVKT